MDEMSPIHKKEWIKKVRSKGQRFGEAKITHSLAWKRKKKRKEKKCKDWVGGGKGRFGGHASIQLMETNGPQNWFSKDPKEAGKLLTVHKPGWREGLIFRMRKSRHVITSGPMGISMRRTEDGISAKPRGWG